MAYVISILSEHPDLQQGEKVLLLSLSVQPRLGYRLKALSQITGRDIGRWISDCPLAISETALLWASRYGWTVQLGEESLDIQQVLDTVPQLTPMNVPGVHPRDALELLMGNLPPKDPSSPETGAVIQLGAARQIAGPTVRPIERARPEPEPRNPRRQRARRLKGEARDMAVFLRDTVRALADGADPEEVRAAVAEGLALDALDDEFVEVAAAPVRAPSALTPALVASGVPPLPPHYTQPASVVTSYNPLPPLPPGVRPLMPGEALPGMDPAQTAEFNVLTEGTDPTRQKVLDGWAHDAIKYGNRPALSPEQQAEVDAWHVERRVEAERRALNEGAAARAAYGVPDGPGAAGAPAPPTMTPPRLAPLQAPAPQVAVGGGAPTMRPPPAPILVPPAGAVESTNGHGHVYDPMTALSPWAQRALGAAGLITLELVAGYSEAELGKVNGIGPKIVAEVREWLVAHGHAPRLA